DRRRRSTHLPRVRGNPADLRLVRHATLRRRVAAVRLAGGGLRRDWLAGVRSAVLRRLRGRCAAEVSTLGAVPGSVDRHATAVLTGLHREFLQRVRYAGAAPTFVLCRV